VLVEVGAMAMNSRCAVAKGEIQGKIEKNREKSRKIENKQGERDKTARNLCGGG
jgi:hypothetical protein